MGIALVTFTALFILITSAGLLLFYRAAMLQRLAQVLPERQAESMLRRLAGAPAGASIQALVQPFERVLPKSPEEVSVVQKRLIRAGYRKDIHVNVFYGAKVLVPVALCVFATVTGVYEYGALFVYAIAIGLGFLLPDFWLGNRISNRQLNIRLGLPDALDLLVICIEAGLSLDQALMRTADELAMSHPELSDEFGLVNLEQRAGRPRTEAWKHLAERTEIDIIRSLVAMIVQADQFGTSIAKGLRVHSDTLRTQRRQHAEEQAAKTTVKLVFPLVFFIFPSLFLVTLGPALILMFESFAKYLNG
jgi:tight adherence protein C